MAKFEETGKLEDIDYQTLQKLVNLIPQEEYHREDRRRFSQMDNLHLAIQAEYMRRNLAVKDTIVYEGAVRETLLPVLIERLLQKWDTIRLVQRMLMG